MGRILILNSSKFGHKFGPPFVKVPVMGNAFIMECGWPPFYPVSRFSSNSPSSKFGQSEKRYGVGLDLFDADNIVSGQINQEFLSRNKLSKLEDLTKP